MVQLGYTLGKLSMHAREAGHFIDTTSAALDVCQPRKSILTRLARLIRLRPTEYIFVPTNRDILGSLGVRS
jgi:hypothetical protein